MASRRSPASPRPPEPPPPAAAPRRAVGANPSKPLAAAVTAVTREARHAMIAEAAYLRAERRGFAAGGETEDWLAAELEVDALLKAGARGPAQ